MNVALDSHPLIGQTFTYRPDLPPYDPEADREPGVLVIGPGMTATVLLAFHDWNGVEGLTMCYVLCNETGMHTHMSPRELGADR
jgi:hypothetical protein